MRHVSGRHQGPSAPEKNSSLKGKFDQITYPHISAISLICKALVERLWLRCVETGLFGHSLYTSLMKSTDDDVSRTLGLEDSNMRIGGAFFITGELEGGRDLRKAISACRVETVKTWRRK